MASFNLLRRDQCLIKYYFGEIFFRRPPNGLHWLVTAYTSEWRHWGGTCWQHHYDEHRRAAETSSCVEIWNSNTHPLLEPDERKNPSPIWPVMCLVGR